MENKIQTRTNAEHTMQKQRKEEEKIVEIVLYLNGGKRDKRQINKE